MRTTKYDVCYESLLLRIEKMEPGEIVIASDFSELSDPQNREKALDQMAQEGILHRILPGIYELPEYRRRMLAQRPDKVARAIARKQGWSIIPSGENALYALALVSRPPKVWKYVSSGKRAEYTFDSTTIQFTQTMKKELFQISYHTALVIQSLKAVGKDRIPAHMINQIAVTTSRRGKALMLIEAKYETAWVYDMIQKICEGELQRAEAEDSEEDGWE